MNRKRWNRRLAFVSAWLVALTFAVLVWLWARGGGQPNIAVDYVAMVQAEAKAVPEANRAWPVYLEAIAALPSRYRDSDTLCVIEDCYGEGPDIDAQADALERYADGVELLRRAAAMPALGLVPSDEAVSKLDAALGVPPGTSESWGPVTPDTSMFDYALASKAYSKTFRIMARILAADARVALCQSDGDRFVRDIEALLGMAEQYRSLRVLINQLTAAEIRALASKLVLEAIQHHPNTLEPLQLERLADVYGELAEGPGFRYDYEPERWYFLDSMQRMYTDDGNGDGRFTAPGSLSSQSTAGSPQPILILRPLERVVMGWMTLGDAGRAEATETYNRLLDAGVAWSNEPSWSRGDPPYTKPPPGSDISMDPFPSGDVWALQMLPSIGPLTAATLSSNATEDGVRVVIAMERFRLGTGSWPRSLDELIPEFLPAVPQDGFDGQPLRYRLTEEGPVVYSVGFDRDDDGGRHTRYAWSEAAFPYTAENVAEGPDSREGDWVLFPFPEDE
jgi:hypothetical protein